MTTLKVNGKQATMNEAAFLGFYLGTLDQLKEGNIISKDDKNHPLGMLFFLMATQQQDTKFDKDENLFNIVEYAKSIHPQSFETVDENCLKSLVMMACLMGFKSGSLKPKPESVGLYVCHLMNSHQWQNSETKFESIWLSAKVVGFWETLRATGCNNLM